jgi:hypothetical protein
MDGNTISLNLPSNEKEKCVENSCGNLKKFLDPETRKFDRKMWRWKIYYRRENMIEV